VPERLNGRDWKSRNGGNLVRGFESPPLRHGAGPPAVACAPAEAQILLRTEVRFRTLRNGKGAAAWAAGHRPGAETLVTQRPALRLVEGSLGAPVPWLWFCGHCAAPSPGGTPPPPSARVCNSCGLGLLLEAREDVVPTNQEAFLVVDASLLVQAMSQQAQSLLGISEELGINKPVAELLVPADAESQGRTSFAAAIAQAADGQDPDTTRSTVRPWNTFGVRMRARIATCGPPRAALVVLEDGRPPPLRAVGTR
jgi:hypothetical protein